MDRLCMRPGCDRPAVSRLSYDTIFCQVWLDPVPERPGPAQEICELHTSRLTVPRGWVLCDRRGDAPALFVTPAEPAVAAEGPRATTNGTSRNGSADRPATNGDARKPRRRVRTAAEPVLFESPVEAEDSGPAGTPAARRNGSSSSTERRVAATVPVSVEPVDLPTVQPEEQRSAEPVGVEEPVGEEASPEAEETPVEAPVAAPAEPEQEEVLPTSPLLARAFRATGPQRSVLTQTLMNEAD